MLSNYGLVLSACFFLASLSSPLWSNNVPIILITGIRSHSLNVDGIDLSVCVHNTPKKINAERKKNKNAKFNGSIYGKDYYVHALQWKLNCIRANGRKTPFILSFIVCIVSALYWVQNEAQKTWILCYLIAFQPNNFAMSVCERVCACEKGRINFSYSCLSAHTDKNSIALCCQKEEKCRLYVRCSMWLPHPWSYWARERVFFLHSVCSSSVSADEYILMSIMSVFLQHTRSMIASICSQKDRKALNVNVQFVFGVNEPEHLLRRVHDKRLLFDVLIQFLIPIVTGILCCLLLGALAISNKHRYHLVHSVEKTTAAQKVDAILRTTRWV